MKGIILAGGSGTRLYPVTKAISKHLIPIYDKPMIYYPLSTLMLSGITEVLVISTIEDQKSYKKLLKDGSHLGITITYEIQEEPRGIAEAFIIGENFIGEDSVCLILGDNIFYGYHFDKITRKCVEKNNGGATICGYYVNDPRPFGVVECDENDMAISIEEKPKIPKSNYAVPGLYFYNNDVIEIAKNIKPSARGELEITTVNQEYLNQGKLKVEKLGRGTAWLDTGTHENLLKASNFVNIMQERTGKYISCPEEVAFNMGYIDDKQLLELAEETEKIEYGQYLKSLINLKC